MKKFVLLVSSVLFITTSCERGIIQSEPKALSTSNEHSIKETNEALDAIGKAVALSTKENSFLTLIKEETGKQFDYDYDILYEFIAERKVSTQIGYTSVENLIAHNLSIPGSELNKLNYLRNWAKDIKNLQISVNMNFEKWNPVTYTPKVAVMPTDFDEKKHTSVIAYSKNGQASEVTQKDDKSDIFLVLRESERVDKHGKLRVDASGIVLGQQDRNVTAAQAYEEVNMLDRNAILNRVSFASNVVRVGEEKQLLEELRIRNDIKKREQLKSFSKQRPLNDVKLPEVKFEDLSRARLLSCAAAPSTPTITRCFSPGQYQMYLEWTDVPNSTYFEIYREKDLSGTYQLVKTINKADNPATTYLDLIWEEGSSMYSYRIKAYNGSNECQSPISNSASARKVCWRYNNQPVAISIFMNQAAWDSCVGLFDNRIELEIRSVRYLKGAAGPEYGLIKHPKTTHSDFFNAGDAYGNGLVAVNLGYSWSFENFADEIAVHVVEDDGDQEGVTVTLSMTAKFTPAMAEIGQGVSVQFKIDDDDEQLGFTILRYWSCGDWHALTPPGGSAWITF